MVHYLRRLILAFCLSAACYYATEDWYHRTKVSLASTGRQEPIALLQELTDEVQRKPLTRVIWETISKDENLFAGEAIRTSDKSEAKILFLKSGTIIELEPDSLVVLEETDGGLSLDFLKGNLFVKNVGGAQAGAGAALTLKSGKSEINLNNADISLSKKKQGDSVDVQVYGGTAQIKQGQKTMTIDEAQSGTLSQKGMDVTKNQIQVISPKAGDAVYIDPRKKEPVVFQWKKLSSDYRVFVERGKTRSKLKRNARITAKGDRGTVALPSRVGRYYWRLVAEPLKDGLPVLRSAVIPFPIVAKVPPLPLKPDHQAQLVIESAKPTVRIKWANPAKLKRLMVEVATDPSLKSRFIQESLDAKLNFKDLPLEKTGTYFWRLTGFMEVKGKLLPVSSEVRNFQVQVGAELVPPALRSPLAQQSINFNQVLTKGLFLSWDPVPGIPSYEVILEKGDQGERRLASTQDLSDLSFAPVLNQSVASTPVRINDLKSGVYRWTVRSINADGKKSEPAAHRVFTITDMPRVNWARGPEPEDYLYYTNRPSMIVQWLKGSSDKVVRWRYRLAQDGTEITDAKWQITDKPQVRRYVDTEGEWQIQVEALNAKNKSIARSSTKVVNVTPKPLLPSPQFAQELPEILKANRKGNLNVQWDPVAGASKYQVILKNKRGRVVKKETVTSASSQMSRLKPGAYQVYLQSVDAHNRVGPLSPGRKLEVPRTSDIKAPKLKTIQVK